MGDMGRPRVAIDGHAGTAGLRIRDWLAGRADLDVLALEEPLRKQEDARRELLNAVDVAVLCLPDGAAREAVGWIENPATRVLDASNAHRLASGWVYGLPELEPGQREAIVGASRVSNPGCYPSGVILLLRPLIDGGLLHATAAIAVHAVSGYSGGGRAMIERWESPERSLLALPFEVPYALDVVHKHLPEMTRFSGLLNAPQFRPAVGPFRCGMRIEVPLHAELLGRGATPKAIWEALDARYAKDTFVTVAPLADSIDADELSLDPRCCNDTNRIELRVVPNPAGHVLLIARLDNLGKGAAGVAIQNLNLMLGLPEAEGLPG